MRRFVFRYIALASAAGIAVGVTAYVLTPDPDSGLAVATVSQSMSAHVEVIFPYPAGQGPLAHYTEHLVWLNAVGNTARTADRHANASTSAYTVGYWLSGGPDDLPDLLRTLAGIFDPLDLPTGFALEERDIILREYDFRLSHNTDAQAAEAMDAFLYHGHGLAASIIGTPDQIRALDYDDARTFHAQTHLPEHARVVVISDKTKREVRQAMRAAGWPDMQADRPPTAPPPFHLAPPAQTSLRYPQSTAAPRLIWRRVVALTEPVQFDLLETQTALLRDILDSNLAGGLVAPLLTDAAVARSLDIQIWPIDENHIELMIHAAPDRGVTLTALQTAVEAALADVAGTGIPEDSHTRVLNRFDSYWPDWDDPEQAGDWMASYIRNRTAALRQPLSRRAVERLHGRLSLSATNALLQQLAGQGRTASALIGPEESFE